MLMKVTVILFCCFSTIFARHGCPIKPYKPPLEPIGTLKPQRISCYVCGFTYNSNSFQVNDDSDPACLPKTMNEYLPENQKWTLRNFSLGYQCPAKTDKYCMTEVRLVSNVVVGVQRGCASECRYRNSCSNTGYGLLVSTCTSCCNADHCNNWGDYDFYGGMIKTDKADCDDEL